MLSVKTIGLFACAALIPASLWAASQRTPRFDAVASKLRRITPEPGTEHVPAARVRIALEPGPVLNDGTQQARVVITPLVDAETMEVAVTADEGLRVLRGEPWWRTSGRRQQPIRRDFLLGGVPAPAARRSQRLVVTARMTFPLGAGETLEKRRVEAATAAWEVAPREPSIEEAHPGARRVRTRDGRRILEIPGE